MTVTKIAYENVNTRHFHRKYLFLDLFILKRNFRLLLTHQHFFLKKIVFLQSLFHFINNDIEECLKICHRLVLELWCFKDKTNTNTSIFFQKCSGPR